MTGIILPGLIGLFFAGPFGLLIGLGIGFYMSTRGSASFGRAHTNGPETQKVFFETLFRLLGHIAKADGQITPDEIAQTEATMAQSRLSTEHRQAAIALFKEGAAPEFDRRAQIQAFQAQCSRSPVLHQTLMVYLISLALADGKIDSSEQTILAEVAMSLGMNRVTLEHLINMVKAQSHFRAGGQGGGGPYSQPNTKQELDLAYKALGVSKDISDKDLKRAYRKLASEHHPDKLMGQGVPEDMIQMATERSQEIHTAYDLICEHRKA